MTARSQIIALAALASVLAIAVIESHRSQAARLRAPPLAAGPASPGYVIETHDLRATVRDAMAFTAALERIGRGDGHSPVPSTASEVAVAASWLIKNVIDPHTWSSNGGPQSQAEMWAGRFIVTQSPANQQRIAELLRALPIRQESPSPTAGTE